MNKLTKGAIAGAAGLTLLLGGGTTFALWNSTADVAGGTIVAGDLVVTAATDGAGQELAGTWIVEDGTVAGTAIPVLANFTASPGDVLVYTKSMSVTASGDNLTALLKVSPASIVASSTAPADVALAKYLEEGVTLTASGTGIDQVSAARGAYVATPSAEYIVTAGAAGVKTVVTVAVTITFPKDGVAGVENDTKLGSVSLEKLTVSLTQI